MSPYIHFHFAQNKRIKEIAGLAPAELRVNLMKVPNSRSTTQSAFKNVHEATIVPTSTAVTFSVAVC